MKTSQQTAPAPSANRDLQEHGQAERTPHQQLFPRRSRDHPPGHQVHHRHFCIYIDTYQWNRDGVTATSSREVAGARMLRQTGFILVYGGTARTNMEIGTISTVHPVRRHGLAVV